MLNCYIVKDLLPSYIDGLVSAETESEIQEHLQNCEACKLLYEQLKTPMKKFTPQTGKKEIDFLKKIRAGTIKKLVAGFCVILLVFAALTYFFAVGRPADKADITYITRVEGEAWTVEITLTNGKSLIMRTEPIYSEANKEGEKRIVGYILKPYEAVTSPLADDNTFLFGCETKQFTDSDFSVVLQLNGGDVVFTAENFIQQQP